MSRVKIIVPFMLVLLFSFGVNAKDDKPDQILIVQSLINEAYEKGYVDAAPVEMDFIQKKVIEAKELQGKRKKKDFDSLIAEIKADLKIVKQRYKVNEMHRKLEKLKQDNLQSKKMLDELKRQL
jgi:hypothetical protein